MVHSFRRYQNPGFIIRRCCKPNDGRQFSMHAVGTDAHRTRRCSCLYISHDYHHQGLGASKSGHVIVLHAATQPASALKRYSRAANPRTKNLDV